MMENKLDLFRSLTAVPWKWGIRALAMILGAACSPCWWLSRRLLSHALGLEMLLSQGVRPSVVGQLVQRCRELPPGVVCSEVLPGLFICIVATLGFMLLCGRLTGLLEQALEQRFSVKSV